MLFHWIEAEGGIIGLYLALVLFGVALYAVLAGTSYLVFFVWQRERFFPDYRPDREELLRSMRWAFYSIAGNSALMVPIELLVIRGESRIYFSLDEHPWWYVPLGVLAVLVVTETLIYWVHRALHTRLLYRWLHVRHHQFRVPTPLASVSFHPLDSFAQAAPYHLCAFLIPLNVWVYHGLVTFVTIWAVMIHDRIRWSPTEWVNHTGCHTAHHWYFRYNYGQFFTVWDRLCGTFHSPASLPSRFYSSWPAGQARELGTS